MHTVEGGLEVPSSGFIGGSSHHLMHRLELQEQRRTRPIKTHVIADSWLAFFYQRWENRCCRQGRALSYNQVFGQAVTVRELGKLALIHKSDFYLASVSGVSRKQTIKHPTLYSNISETYCEGCCTFTAPQGMTFVLGYVT